MNKPILYQWMTGKDTGSPAYLEGRRLIRLMLTKKYAPCRWTSCIKVPTK